jgi:hypothetical protein
MMKRSLMTAAIVSIVIASAVLVAQKQNFTLINKTGGQIDKVFVSPVKTDTWGEDILGRDVLDDGEKVDIKFPHSETACHYDLKIVDENKASIEWNDINLCECDSLTLKYDKKSKETTAECKAPMARASR